MQIVLPSKQPPGNTDLQNMNIVPDQVSPMLPQQVTEYLQEQVSALEEDKVE